MAKTTCKKFTYAKYSAGGDGSAAISYTGGVMLDDGSTRRTYTADDFDDMGNLTVRFLKSPGVTTSVCHRTFIYQNGVEIYNNRWR